MIVNRPKWSIVRTRSKTKNRDKHFELGQSMN